MYVRGEPDTCADCALKSARRQETDVEGLMAKLVAEEKARSTDAATHRAALDTLEAQRDELQAGSAWSSAALTCVPEHSDRAVHIICAERCCK